MGYSKLLNTSLMANPCRMKPVAVNRALRNYIVRSVHPSRCYPPRCEGSLNNRLVLVKTTTTLHEAPILRWNSSVAPSANRNTTSNSGHAQDAPAMGMTWTTFFKLRKVRRRYNLVASVSSAAGMTFLGTLAVQQVDIVELLGPQMGDLNPFIILGLITAGFTTVGWLSGPMFGSAIFRTFNKNTAAEIISKEREFYRRIKKYRVDPSSQSIANPVPDYYGEKISSVGGYRQWLKDQRAFNKKRQSF